MNVYEKLNAVRTAFLAKEHKKSGRNAYAGFSYFELADFLPETLQLFAGNGLCGHFHVENNMALLDVLNTEKPDEKIVFSCPLGSAALKGCHEIQNIGACITYARRYLWGCVVELIENDALDASAGNENSAGNEKPDEPAVDDCTDVLVAMRDASTVEALQAITKPAYKRAQWKDRETINAEYKRLKAVLEAKKS